MKKTKKIEKLQTENPFIKPNDISDCPINLIYMKYILSKEAGIALSYGHKNPVPHRLN